MSTSHAPSPCSSPTGFYSGPALTSLDETWSTPRPTYDRLNKEFRFVLDSCALAESTLVPSNWYGPDHQDPTRRDALVRDWAADSHGGAVWMNPPYGRKIGDWMAKAAKTSDSGATVVCLVPARTDTAWMWDTAFERQASGRAEIRFLRGRLKFGGSKNSAPFPSCIVVFRPA